MEQCPSQEFSLEGQQHGAPELGLKLELLQRQGVHVGWLPWLSSTSHVTFPRVWHRAAPWQPLVHLIQVFGEKHNIRLGIQDNFLYCYQKAFISTMALDTIPSSGLWRELTVGTGCSENRVSHGGDALKV